MEFENVEYYPINPNFYNYKPMSELNKFGENIELNNYENINICCYEVNNNGKYPFLKFLLLKNMVLQNLSFPKIPISSYIYIEKLIDYTKIYLYELLLLKDYDEFVNTIEINGFYEDNKGEIFLFLNLTNCKLVINDVYSENNIWFGLVDEILNKKQICNMKIHNLTYQFFNENYDFCILLDENNEAYEIPVAGYVGKPENKLNFTYIFGEIKNDKNGLLGAYYYFTNFENAVKKGYQLMDKPTTNKCGVVRFALFLGNTKYIENLLDDDMDESNIKKQKINDNNVNEKNIEQLTLRISDHDGNWVKTFDSCYLGHLLLDNGKMLENTPLIVVKDYNQQIPLSYHYINAHAFEMNENHIKYAIL